jgi:ABC-type multidrug transport system ATPase subunit
LLPRALLRTSVLAAGASGFARTPPIAAMMPAAAATAGDDTVSPQRRDEQLLRECGATVSVMPDTMPPAEEVGLPLSEGSGSARRPARGATIAFRAVSVVIPLPRKQAAAAERVLLSNITGVIPGGDMYALMGGSGAGKTTLLDMASQRKTDGRLGGAVLFDGRVPTRSELKRDTAYIQQDDALLGWATVAETLAFTAEMKLPRSMSAADKAARVEEVIEQMGLTLARNTFVGSRLVRGLSGGERKRTGVACGLICKPRWCAILFFARGAVQRRSAAVCCCFLRPRARAAACPRCSIFMDEPTSGLDSAIAAEVMASVKALQTTSGCTLLITIHQPSPGACVRILVPLYARVAQSALQWRLLICASFSSVARRHAGVYMLFDGLVLLHRGALCYFGPGRDEPCVFFGAQGFAYRPGWNIAEFLLETISSAGGSSSRTAAAALVDAASPDAAEAGAAAVATHDFTAYFAKSELCANQKRLADVAAASDDAAAAARVPGVLGVIPKKRCDFAPRFSAADMCGICVASSGDHYACVHGS